MAFLRSYSDGALSVDVQGDANLGADSLKYRTLLKIIDNGLGVRDMEKLKYLCHDLGVAPRKFETMTRGIYLFTELEKLALITADDISLLVVLMQAINRYDLVKKLKSWSSKEGSLAHRLSAYRSLMLRISDSLSRDERDQFTFYLSDGDSPLPVAAIEECKSLLQLFILMEKYTLIGPGDLEYLTNIMQSIGNIAIVKEIKEYLAIERSSVHNTQPSSSLSYQLGQDGRVAYNTGNQSNMRRDSAPTFEGYTQNPPWDGQVAGHMPELPRYKMDRLPRGMCIIFNAENFAVEHLKKREGTQKDVEALENTFKNNLKFTTQVKNDPTKNEYKECLQEIANMDHSEYDCFVCVILSHGCEGHVFGTDGEKVSINFLTGLFRGDRVPSLVNKPKLFFIQACQGNYPQAAVDIFQQDGPTTLPFESDTLVSHATIPGYASFRSANSGSLFIISLCNIINTYYKEKVDLLSMLTMVNERMSRRALKGKWMEIGKQIGNPSHCLRKQIFFNEGLNE